MIAYSSKDIQQSNTSYLDYNVKLKIAAVALSTVTLTTQNYSKIHASNRKGTIEHEIKTLQREINTSPNRRDLILKLKQLQREYARS